MAHTSSTVKIPEVGDVPKHIAIIMDGNGRWAKKRLLPRISGHPKGVISVRKVVEACAKKNVKYLTLFAFSSENWRRPTEEILCLMELFIKALEKEVKKLNENGIRMRVIGNLGKFNKKIQTLIEKAEKLTENNTGLTLTIAANYGGRWDILQATRKLIEEAVTKGEVGEINEASFEPHLAMAYAPEPDLFIRTGGEQRISNFLLWSLAYTELYFTDTLWPDFNEEELNKAITSYQTRERRFGRTSAQLQNNNDSPYSTHLSTLC